MKMSVVDGTIRKGRPRGTYANTPHRRREIVVSATEVFAAHGYSGGSLRQVAKDIGVSVTSVTHHFPTKESLLEAVLEQADLDAAHSIDLDAARDGLRGTVVRLAETGQDHPHLLRLLTVLSAEATAPDHPAHDWLIARYERVEDEVTRWAIADPALALDSIHARSLARRIVAVWDGLQLRWLLHSDFDLVNELSDALAAMIE